MRLVNAEPKMPTRIATATPVLEYQRIQHRENTEKVLLTPALVDRVRELSGLAVNAENISAAYANRDEITGNIGSASVRAFQVSCLSNVRKRLHKSPAQEADVTPKQAVRDLIACYENERVALAAKYAIELQSLMERQKRDVKSLRCIMNMTEND